MIERLEPEENGWRYWFDQTEGRWRYTSAPTLAQIETVIAKVNEVIDKINGWEPVEGP